ncbi:MAG: cation:proton antiporter [Rhodobiaceae bacterium]|nr:cation:proton antiporter [Rhodobiaceae bacterium]MCC0054711.1 cation:proton antiporter [Rhodobiaceae bacterium]
MAVAEANEALADTAMGAHFDMTGLAVVVAAAVLLGLGLTRLKQPAVVGYILAGVILGPSGLQLVERSGSMSVLAELGVIMLLFLIGMELSLKAFMRVIGPSLFVVAGQISIAAAFTFLFGTVLGWPTGQSLLLAFIIALSSTAVAIKMLDDIDELRTPIGQITVGVLIAQDIIAIPMLIFADSLGGRGFDWLGVVKSVAALVFVIALVRVLSARSKIHFPFTDAMRGNADLMTMGSLAVCFSAAAVTGLIGLSAAYGAFLAGLVIANTTLRVSAIKVTEPIQSVLVFVFFLSIGLLLDLGYVWDNLGTVSIFVILVLAVKSIVNIALLHLAGTPWQQAFPAGLIMAQIGEFSFILASIGVTRGVLDSQGYQLALTVIAISLLVSPFWMANLRRFHDVAAQGVIDLKATLAEVYAVELEEMARGRALLFRTAHGITLRGRAMRKAWKQQRRSRKASDDADKSEKS